MQLTDFLTLFNFETPLRLTDSTPWHGHIPFAFWLVSKAKPDLLVELGVHKGDSFSALCQACTKLDHLPVCYGVDTWEGDKHASFYEPEIYRDCEAFVTGHYGSFASLLRMTFDDAVENFVDGTIDILHIDGYHTYDAVKHDFESWLPKISDRGIVLLHDTSVRRDDFGVWRFWDEVSKVYPSFEFKHSNGLGVLLIGKSVPAELLILPRLTKREEQAVQKLFAAFGELISLKQRISVGEQKRTSDTLHEISLKLQRLYDLMDTSINDLTEGGQGSELAEKLHVVTAHLEQMVLDNQHLISSVDQNAVQVQTMMSASYGELNSAVEALQSVSGKNFEDMVEQQSRLADMSHGIMETVTNLYQTSIHEQATSLQQELLMAQSRARQYEELYGIIEGSTSWRVTRPLRYLGRVARLLLRRSRAQTASQAHTAAAPELHLHPTSANSSREHEITQTAAPVLQGRRKFPTYRRYRVAFVSGLPKDNPSFDYRVANALEALGADNAVVVLHEELPNRIEVLFRCDVIVLYRLAWDEHVERLVAQARLQAIPLVFDTDDYIFEPSLATVENIDGLRYLSEHEIKEYHRGVLRYRRTMMECDAVISTTNPLGDAARNLGRTTFVIRNALSDQKLRFVGRIERAPQTDSTVTVGYASGTMTHQKDFRVAAHGLSRAMQEDPNIRLVVVGKLDIREFPSFEALKDRITLRPLVPHDRLLEEIARFDINIAPLELGNPFCESKSELKYFDAALVGVPTIASPTEPFREAITHGTTGLLASTEDDWYESIRLLVSNVDLRKEIADNARIDVNANYTTASRAAEYHLAFESVIRQVRQLRGVADSQLRVTFLVPPVTRGSGGHGKIFSIARALSVRGHDVRIVVEGVSSDFLSAHDVSSYYGLGDHEVSVAFGYEELDCSDAMIATYWKTAYIAQEHSYLASALFYFIQDYEPYFFPMSTDYILAEESYKLGLNGISYGPWCQTMIQELHGVHVRAIDMFIDKSTYLVDEQALGVKQRENIILFFARPDMPRRGYELGLQALRILSEKLQGDPQNERVRVLAFGGNVPAEIEDNPLIENLGVLTVEALADLYRRSSIGLAFSTTNPSMVPYEMMASGMAVVDLNHGKNEVNYDGGQAAFLVDPRPETIAEALLTLLRDTSLRDAYARNGWGFVSRFTDEDVAIKQFEEILLDNI